MKIMEKMTIYEKLNILSDAAKYDVACTSSGSERSGDGKGIGNCVKSGICHSFSADGRCISLLKILFTNECIFDCKYCINRSSNDVIRTSFTPEEVCRLTIEFYRRNYIEGLFLSSGVIESPNHTMELLYATLLKLRREYHFQGYIHVKAIPGADPELIRRTGFLADRMSVNLELPTAEGLRKLAPHKSRKNILTPMRLVQNQMEENRQELMTFRHAPEFVPAGQSTQMIIGATPETDYQILHVAESLYQKFQLKRVFYSAFVHVNDDAELPARCDGGPPLLRVPGIGYKSAGRIVRARKLGKINFEDLKKMGVVLRRAIYFITCSGKMMYPIKFEEDAITRNLLSMKEKLPREIREMNYRQLTLFDDVTFHSAAGGLR